METPCLSASTVADQQGPDRASQAPARCWWLVRPGTGPFQYVHEIEQNETQRDQLSVRVEDTRISRELPAEPRRHGIEVRPLPRVRRPAPPGRRKVRPTRGPSTAGLAATWKMQRRPTSDCYRCPALWQVPEWRSDSSSRSVGAVPRPAITGHRLRGLIHSRASVHYWDTDVRHLGQSTNKQRRRMSEVPSMAATTAPTLGPGSFVPRSDVGVTAAHNHLPLSTHHRSNEFFLASLIAANSVQPNVSAASITVGGRGSMNPRNRQLRPGLLQAAGRNLIGIAPSGAEVAAASAAAPAVGLCMP